MAMSAIVLGAAPLGRYASVDSDLQQKFWHRRVHALEPPRFSPVELDIERPVELDMERPVDKVLPPGRRRAINRLLHKNREGKPRMETPGLAPADHHGSWPLYYLLNKNEVNRPSMAAAFSLNNGKTFDEGKKLKDPPEGSEAWCGACGRRR